MRDGALWFLLAHGVMNALLCVAFMEWREYVLTLAVSRQIDFRPGKITAEPNLAAIHEIGDRGDGRRIAGGEIVTTRTKSSNVVFVIVAMMQSSLLCVVRS